MSEFGTLLLATFLGYHKSEKHGGFIRARWINDSIESPVIAFDFAPFGKPVPSGPRKGKHICWWDSPELLDKSPRLQKVTNVNYAFTILLNDNGEEIRP